MKCKRPMAHRPAMEGVTNCKACEREAEEPMLNNAQIKQIMHANDLAITLVKELREEKEAMLKHITDLEAGLNNLITLWDMESSLTEYEDAITHWRNKFPYLFDLDDGYEPPEHMTADDFNEMHSGPFQPDDTGYMDGDE